ncbi:SAM-dependent methyltransferase [Candidatus Peregrinibacteria bacterium]|jgi:hypothetical protein|nr:SAM-dependent methyltransferase [Candidatus Peregrinibacteria bacterium]MBT4056493.1 SAM-dependent methyltransferase [Candidatus Peregrinibacteria bacterium]
MAIAIQEILTFLVLLVVIIVMLGLTTSFIVAFFGGGPFVPTPKRAVKEVLKHAKIKKGDVVIDIGAGDGRFLHYAEKLYGADAIGYEIDPFVYAIAILKKVFLGWKGKIIRGNFQNYSLRKADIIICYMLPSTLKKYQKKFDKELRKGCKVISYTFHIGTWKPIKEIEPDPILKTKRIYIYKVEKPAKKRTKKKIKSKKQ